MAVGRLNTTLFEMCVWLCILEVYVGAIMQVNVKVLVTRSVAPLPV
jgi:hypothetical protein